MILDGVNQLLESLETTSKEIKVVRKGECDHPVFPECESLLDVPLDEGEQWLEAHQEDDWREGIYYDS